MRHEELLELADVYALGALEGEELKEFEDHLSSGCAQCRARLRDAGAVLTPLAGACEPLSPPPDVKTKIFEQIEADKPSFTFTFAHEGVWQTIAAGVRAKVLNLDPDR
jgi:anti-sigma-K factor RskA